MTVDSLQYLIDRTIFSFSISQFHCVQKLVQMKASLSLEHSNKLLSLIVETWDGLVDNSTWSVSIGSPLNSNTALTSLCTRMFDIRPHGMALLFFIVFQFIPLKERINFSTHLEFEVCLSAWWVLPHFPPHRCNYQHHPCRGSGSGDLSLKVLCMHFTVLIYF